MVKTVINNYLEFCDWLKVEKRPVMSFDTETTSLKYFDLECIGFSLATDTAACYVKMDGWNHPADCWRLLDDVLLIIHNAVFDLKVMYKYGIEPKKIFCTLVGAKLCDENLFHYGLKDLAADWLEIPYQEIKKYDEVCTNVHSFEFADYAMNDAIWTYQLYQYEMDILKRENLVYLAEEIEMPFQFCLRDMEINGIFVNMNELKEAKPRILKLMEESIIKLCGHANIDSWYEEGLFGDKILKTSLNFNSPKQLINLVENKLGFEITERTKKGGKSFGKNTKFRLKDKHPFFSEFIIYDELSNLISNFVTPCENLIDSDGRLRTSYNLKRTGRLSSSEPDLQNLPNPKRKKLIYNYRTVFIPKPGNVLVKADYSGQELRNLAEVSHDKILIDAFNSNKDLHLVTANSIFKMGLSEKEITTGTKECTEVRKSHEDKRKKANTLNYATLYGAFARRIAQDNHVSVQEAQRWLDEFDKLYPGVKDWKQRVSERVRKYGYISTLMGRRRRFPFYQSGGKWEKAKIERQAANFEIQGFSADQMKIAAVKIRQYQDKYRARLILSVHDELVWELPSEYAKEFSSMVKHTMEHCVVLSVPILVDVTIVSSYGD
jgi:DNA polymerase-1